MAHLARRQVRTRCTWDVGVLCLRKLLQPVRVDAVPALLLGRALRSLPGALLVRRP